MPIDWHPVLDDDTQVATLRDVLRLQVRPYLHDSRVWYSASVANMAMKCLYQSANHRTVDEAKRAAEEMASLVVSRMMTELGLDH